MALGRVLFLAPYAAMGDCARSVADDYPELEVDVEVGDLERALMETVSAFSRHHDLVVSRGGTAQLLREEVALPVIEVPLLMEDVLRALGRLPAGVPTAVVGFANVLEEVEQARDLLPGGVIIRRLWSVGEAGPALEELRGAGVEAFACDSVSYGCARDMGLDAALMESGANAVRRSLGMAAAVLEATRSVGARDRLLWRLVRAQSDGLAIFDEDGGLAYSDLGPADAPVLAELARRAGGRATGRFVLQRGRRLYRVSPVRETVDGRRVTAFSLRTDELHSPGDLLGIAWEGADEVADRLSASLFARGGGAEAAAPAAAAAAASGRPVMVVGPPGSGRGQAARMLHLASANRGGDLVRVDCALLDRRSFHFLTSSPSSPLFDGGQTVYLRGMAALGDGRLRTLLGLLKHPAVHGRNLIVASHADAPETPGGMGAFAEELHAATVRLPGLDGGEGLVEGAVRAYFAWSAEGSDNGIDEDAVAWLAGRSWAQGYPQLERVLLQASATAGAGRVTRRDVVASARRDARLVPVRSGPAEEGPLDVMRPLADVERDVCRLVLDRCEGNRTEAARVLGVGRTTLWRVIGRGEDGPPPPDASHRNQKTSS